jgi:hypothetical protein
VRMMIWSVQLHQIHHVHKAHMEAGKLVAEDCGCRKRFNGRNVSSASKDYVRFNANITRSPLPYTKPFFTVLSSLFF